MREPDALPIEEHDDDRLVNTRNLARTAGEAGEGDSKSFSGAAGSMDEVAKGLGGFVPVQVKAK